MTGYTAGKRNRSRFGIATMIGTMACAAAGMLAAPSPLSAHHSFSAEFDATRQLKVTGDVIELEWTNPHAWIHVRAKEICERRDRKSVV